MDYEEKTLNGGLISFLIPVYNAAKYLPSTLDSIIRQDDGAIEIICVNDGSTDGSQAILDAYQEHCPFMTVLTQRNAGITYARNTALSHATGEWVCFVDDDDLVAEAAVRIYRQYMNPSIDIIYCDYKRFVDGELPQQDPTVYGSHLFSGDDIHHLQGDCINRFRSNRPLISHKTLPTPWAKIYRRNFLKKNGLKFIPEVTHEEDILFNFEALSYCKRAIKIDAVTYYYRWIITSESHRYRPNLIEDIQTTLSQYQRILHDQYPDRFDLYELYRYRILWDLLYCVVLGPLHPRNPGDYMTRKAEFDNLLDSYPVFHDVITDASISTVRFELKQSVLATLIRLRWFWMLNMLRSVIGKAR